VGLKSKVNVLRKPPYTLSTAVGYQRSSKSFWSDSSISSANAALSFAVRADAGFCALLTDTKVQQQSKKSNRITTI
jgi:hypothetical protein